MHDAAESLVLPLLRDLIRIPSINPHLDPNSAGEGEVARFASRWLAGHGIEARLEPVAEGRPNVVARVGNDNGRSLALCAHIDTVSTSGMTIEPFEPTVEDGRVYGRGSYDMKCGVAAVMAALVTLHRIDLQGSVVLSLVADEEYASLGAQHFVAHHPTDACVLTEPSEGELILAHKGFLWLKVTCRGIAAHGSRWDLGDSAIARMGKIVTLLSDFDMKELRARQEDFVGPASLHCGTISGGSGISTYAELCELEVERRTLPGETTAEAFEELVQRIRAVEPAAEVDLLLERPPMTTPRESRIAASARQAVTEVTGRPPKESGVAYWMDAALFSAAGIPTVNYGPGGEGAHGAVEWVDLASVERCAAVLVATARRFLEAR